MKNTIPVTVHILEKEYRVACPPEERDALVRAAALVDERMKAMRDGGRVMGLDRIAVITALNLANELLTQTNKRTGDQISDADPAFVSSRLRLLQEKVEEALFAGMQREL